jgi:hypothetical protein
VILQSLAFQSLANPGAELLLGFDFVLLGLAEKFVEFLFGNKGECGTTIDFLIDFAVEMVDLPDLAVEAPKFGDA